MPIAATRHTSFWLNLIDPFVTPPAHGCMPLILIKIRIDASENTEESHYKSANSKGRPMKKITKEQAEESVRKGAKKVTEEDLVKVLQKRDEIEKKFKGEGPLGRFIADLKLLFAIIKDYTNGQYREIPYWSIAAIVAALLYVVSPVDLIPDFIPGIGLVDDAMVVAACLAMVEQDLLAYKEWKMAIA